MLKVKGNRFGTPDAKPDVVTMLANVDDIRSTLAIGVNNTISRGKKN